MNTKLFFRITAAVISLLTVLSCTKEIDEPIDQPTEPETYTLSIKASKGEFTKGLSLDENTLNAIWDGSEEVYVFLNEELTEQIAILTPDKNAHPDPAACVLEGSFTTLPVDGDVLTLKLTSNNYSGQDGTLAFIASHCDYAVATLNVTGVNNGQIESTEGSASFINQQAIVKFTLKDKVNGTTLLSPTTLTVNDGTSDIATVTPTTPADTYSTNGDGVLYVAIPPIAGKTLTLTATVGEDTYSYSRFPVTFAQGQYYTISVKMIKQRLVDLSALSVDYEAQDGDILTGTPTGNYQISIADKATVTLKDVNITGKGEEYRGFPGITCLGDATILLSGTNSVKGGADKNGSGYGSWPGIFVPYEKTLTIDGTGSLDARPGGSNEWAPGIGSSVDGWCGNIVIQGGSVTATGGYRSAGIGGGSFSETACGNITITGSANVSATGGDGAAGIGCGYNTNSSCGNITISTTGTVTAQGGDAGAGIGTGYHGHCGNITISNGTVTATGGHRGAGIGTGHDEGTGYCECGDITITSGVTSVTATKGSASECSIGKAYSGSNCRSITIGGTLYWNGDAYENDGDSYLKQSPLVYTP